MKFMDRLSRLLGRHPDSLKTEAVRLAWGMPTCVTALEKVMVGVFTTVVPPAPAVAEPMLTTVVDPDAPPVPRFTVLVTPVVVAPVPMP